MTDDFLKPEQINELWESVSPRLDATETFNPSVAKTHSPSNIPTRQNTQILQDNPKLKPDSAALAPIAGNIKILSGAVEQEWSEALSYEVFLRKNKRRDNTIMTIYDDQLKLLRHMAGTLFVLTGQKVRQPTFPIDNKSDLQFLREKYIWERAQAKLYRHYFQNQIFQDIFMDSATQKDNNANKLHKIIENMVI